MSGLQFCDSCGITVFLAARQRALEAGADVALSAVPANLLRVLMLAGLDRVFTPAPGRRHSGLTHGAGRRWRESVPPHPLTLPGAPPPVRKTLGRRGLRRGRLPDSKRNPHIRCGDGPCLRSRMAGGHRETTQGWDGNA
ncbi:STAS domain-containing protein [Streptomyces sp. NPDC019990]|uniref:STAS domain-containing protein n=1 Tax=Streptomyces sp. NPDC019990 TaxID=3154693 RepID=UPI003405DE49